MPKLAAELTDKVMRNLPAPETGNVLYYDPELKGFTARVTCKNARAFVGVYHFEGAERRDTIGGFPEWTARAAREVFKRWKRDVDLGIDPRGELAPDDPLFKPLAEQFLAHGRTKRGRELRPATVRAYRRGLIVYAARLHSRPVQSIRRREIAALIETVATECGTTAAMCAKAALSRFFGWLVAKDLVDANPVAGVEGYMVAKRSRVLSDTELPAIWAATEERSDYSTIVRICLWTGCRRSEAGGMMWSELVDGEWRIPASRTKNHRALVLPLPRQARAALESWPRFVGRDHLFGRAGFQGWSRAKTRLDARLRFNQPWDLHDCRRTVETRMAALGIRKEIVNKILNHAIGSPITEAYDRYDYLAEKAAALQAWADRLGEITGAAPSNVVKLPARA